MTDNQLLKDIVKQIDNQQKETDILREHMAKMVEHAQNAQILEYIVKLMR